MLAAEVAETLQLEETMHIANDLARRGAWMSYFLAVLNMNGRALAWERIAKYVAKKAESCERPFGVFRQSDGCPPSPGPL